MYNLEENWYKKASSKVIIKKAIEMKTLVEKPTTGDGQVELTHLINLLHEIEYKNKMLRDSKSFIHPKRKENIENRLKYFAWKYFKYIKGFTINTFNFWNEQHPIEDPDKWADMVMQMYRDSYGNDLMSYFSKHKITWGGIEYDITEAPADRELIKEYIEQIKNDDSENLLWMIKSFLRDQNIDEETASLDMSNNEDFINYYIRDMDSNQYLEYIDENSIKELVKTKLYRDYSYTWGTTVEQIKENIKNAIDRINSINEKNSISEMTMAISLALNVQHAAGTIMIDYGNNDESYILGDINSAYLDLLSNLDVKEWEDEFHREFAI